MEEKTSGGNNGNNNNNGSAQNLVSSMPYHAAFVFLFPLLIGLLGVYAQGRKKNLFETHMANMCVFLLSAIFYCFAFAADLKYQDRQTSYSPLFSPVAIISGSLSSFSVVSIFVGEIVFIIWAFVPIIIAIRHATLIKNAYNWLRQKIVNIFKFSDIWARFKEKSGIEHSQLPVQVEEKF